LLNLFVDNLASKAAAEDRATAAQLAAAERQTGEDVKKQRQATLEENVTPPSGKVTSSAVALTGSAEEMFNQMWGDKT
jgi:hypothetical protein